MDFAQETARDFPAKKAQAVATDRPAARGNQPKEFKMKVTVRIARIALASVMALGSLASWAQVTPTREDRAQLKADEASLSSEKAKLTKDQAALKEDKAHGRLAAESSDSMRVYRDQTNIQGEKKDMAADRPNSQQLNEDRTSLKKEDAKLQADQRKLKQDNKEGRMAATSPDAEKIYRDNRAIQGQEKDIATDKSKLQADSKK